MVQAKRISVAGLKRRVLADLHLDSDILHASVVVVSVLLLHSIQVHIVTDGLALNAARRGQESGGSVKLALTTIAIVAGLLRVL